MQTKLAIKSLSALAHSGRLGLMRRLIQAGPEGISAGDLAKFAKVGVTTSSAQLQVLANAGLVQAERRSRHVIYSADYKALGILMQFLMQDCCQNRAEIFGLIDGECHAL